MLRSAGYDPEKKVLEVEFLNGAVYEYHGVEMETWNKFNGAESKGKFFIAEVKPNFQCNKLKGKTKEATNGEAKTEATPNSKASASETASEAK
jgi:hypothetical protein